ncbi:hypothetical protein JZO77_03980 [Enterococcus hulanensis]|uniref:HEPN domain-containing protein n=1 Tax=Enterococcus hulanensis TaxID=2559929 RepID=UPI001A8D4D0F|nr:HEPN domain-containing protein [Enterococcus hulanensis]MBO0455895.1 hypothetical protein [Enterococcus hulanensis]
MNKINKKQNKDYQIFFEEFKKTAIWDKGIGFEYSNDPKVTSFYSKDGNVLIFKEQSASNNFIKMVDQLVSDSMIYRNYSRSELINTIIQFFAVEKDEKTANMLLDFLKKIDRQKWFVVLPVYGFEVVEKITFKKIEFIPPKKLIERINEDKEIPISSDSTKRIEAMSKKAMAIVAVKSSSKKQAEAIAKSILRKYLNIFRIFIGSKNRSYNVSEDDIITFLSQSIVFDREKTTINNGFIGATKAVQLNNNFFSESKYIQYLLKLEDENRSRSDIEKRLFLGSQLLGEAFLENSKSTRFLKTMMAVEAMIQVKGEPTKDISLKAAYLMSNDINDVKEIYKNFNMLYDLRSRIAHGEEINFGKYEEYLVMDYATNLLTDLIDEDYDNFQVLEDYIFERKLR